MGKLKYLKLDMEGNILGYNNCDGLICLCEYL